MFARKGRCLNPVKTSETDGAFFPPPETGGFAWRSLDFLLAFVEKQIVSKGSKDVQRGDLGTPNKGALKRLRHDCKRNLWVQQLSIPKNRASPCFDRGSHGQSPPSSLYLNTHKLSELAYDPQTMWIDPFLLPFRVSLGDASNKIDPLRKQYKLMAPTFSLLRSNRIDLLHQKSMAHVWLIRIQEGILAQNLA